VPSIEETDGLIRHPLCCITRIIAIAIAIAIAITVTDPSHVCYSFPIVPV